MDLFVICDMLDCSLIGSGGSSVLWGRCQTDGDSEDVVLESGSEHISQNLN